MASPPTIFSALRRHHVRERMRRLQMLPDAAHWLHEALAADLIERLAFLRHAPRRALIVGDYAVEVDGETVGVVERKRLSELASNVTDGSLLLRLGELATARRAAVVVEDRWADVFRLVHVQPSMVAEMLAAAQVRYPNVPIVFCETRPLAQEWAYRFLGAALAFADEEAVDLG